jgi:hypothetical protein
MWSVTAGLAVLAVVVAGFGALYAITMAAFDRLEAGQAAQDAERIRIAQGGRVPLWRRPVGRCAVPVLRLRRVRQRVDWAARRRARLSQGVLVGQSGADELGHLRSIGDHRTIVLLRSRLGVLCVRRASVDNPATDMMDCRSQPLDR